MASWKSGDGAIVTVSVECIVDVAVCVVVSTTTDVYVLDAVCGSKVRVMVTYVDFAAVTVVWTVDSVVALYLVTLAGVTVVLGVNVDVNNVVVVVVADNVVVGTGLTERGPLLVVHVCFVAVEKAAARCSHPRMAKSAVFFMTCRVHVLQAFVGSKKALIL